MKLLTQQSSFQPWTSEVTEDFECLPLCRQVSCCPGFPTPLSSQRLWQLGLYSSAVENEIKTSSLKIHNCSWNFTLVQMPGLILLLVAQTYFLTLPLVPKPEFQEVQLIPPYSRTAITGQWALNQPAGPNLWSLLQLNSLSIAICLDRYTRLAPC